MLECSLALSRLANYLCVQQNEMDRLDLNHMLMTKTIGKKLFLAPVPQEKTHRILDIGTGTGICKRSCPAIR